jgi:hypothetical protein
MVESSESCDFVLLRNRLKNVPPLVLDSLSLGDGGAVSDTLLLLDPIFLRPVEKSRE